MMGILSKNVISDAENIELAHEQLFFEDKEGGNKGFFNNSTKPREDNPMFLNQYQRSSVRYDDKLMRQAADNVDTGAYHLNSNNCQDWVEKVRKEYSRLEKNQRRKK